MSAFTFNGFNGNSVATTPIGSILSYMGTSDPDGWIICNGVTRNDGGDGRYNNLITAKIGTGTINASYTPPNLLGRFLRGSNSAVAVNTNGGNDSITLSTNEMPAHNHVITDAEHNHSITDKPHNHVINNPAHEHRTEVWGNSSNYMDDNGGYIRGKSWGRTFNSPWVVSTEKTGITFNAAWSGINTTLNAKTNVSLSATGSGVAFSILPQHININYIIKY